jgi:hypothetical protein
MHATLLACAVETRRSVYQGVKHGEGRHTPNTSSSHTVEDGERGFLAEKEERQPDMPRGESLQDDNYQDHVPRVIRGVRCSISKQPPY